MPKPSPQAFDPRVADYMRPTDVAEYTRLSIARLAKLRCLGGGPAFSRVGRSILYSKTDVDTWLVGARRRSTSDRQAAGAPTT